MAKKKKITPEEAFKAQVKEQDKALQQSERQELRKLTNKQTAILENFKISKKNVKNVLLQAICRNMTEEDVINNESYIRYVIDKTGNPPRDESFVLEWLDSLTDEQKQMLLAEYSIDAINVEHRDDYSKDLNNAKEENTRIKKAAKKQLEELIEEYKKLIENHKQLIEALKIQIKETDDAINSINEEIRKVTAQLSQSASSIVGKNKGNLDPETERVLRESAEQVKNQVVKQLGLLNAERTELTKRKTELSAKLTAAIAREKAYTADITNAIQTLEDKAEHTGIYVGKYEGKEPTTVDNEQTQATQTSTTGQKGGGKNKGTPLQLARAKTRNILNYSPDEIKNLINNQGMQDLVNVARDAGPINRWKLKGVYTNLWKSVGNVTAPGLVLGNPPRITQNLNHRADITRILQDFGKRGHETDREALAQLVNYYYNQYDSFSVHDKKEIDKVLEAINIAVLLETTRKFRITNSIANLTNRARFSSINAILNQCRNLSEKRARRKIKIDEKANNLATILGVERVEPPSQGEQYRVGISEPSQWIPRENGTRER